MKQRLGSTGSDVPFYKRVAVAAVAGACGGFVGTPGDMVNVRMQNDVKLPLDQRRNYKHAIDGLVRVAREEGVQHLFRGASSATFRAVLMTVGQLSFYDQIKATLLSSGYFHDNLACHFASSLCAVSTSKNINLMKFWEPASCAVNYRKNPNVLLKFWEPASCAVNYRKNPNVLLKFWEPASCAVN
ncbi:Mitochondrial substrate/solute carrier [Trinorchestia longiramus]|nr:Mitochondrial substrate/solute carrier [Trinorchestia longiramus]